MLIGIAIVVVFGIITICLSIVITSQKEVAVIQRFGKFVGLRRSGLTFKTPFIDWVAYKQSLRIDEISVDVETITKDKVSVHITVAVQYYVEDKDQSIINATKKAFEFFIDEGENQIPKITEFLILNEDFEKIKANLEQTAERKPTKEQIDNYNKKVAESEMQGIAKGMLPGMGM